MPLLATRAKPKEFEPMRHGRETTLAGNPVLKFSRKTAINLHNIGAMGAHEMMVMAVIAFRQKFEPRAASSKFKSFHHAHFLEEARATIDGDEIAVAARKRRKNLLRAQGLAMPPQDFKNGFARTGHFAGVAPEPPL